MKRILRYVVPVDGKAHYHELNGDIVHVATREVDVVEFWAINHEAIKPTKREFVVVGTGFEYKHNWKHVGTAITPGGSLVWHLMEVPRG